MSLLPVRCIHCNTKLKWTDTKVDLWCPNDKCFGVGLERLNRFFTKIKVDDLSRGRLVELSKHGVDNPIKVFQLTKKEIVGLEGFGPKLANKLISNIKSATNNTSVVDIMAASGIFQNESMGLSESRLELVTSKLTKGDIERGDPNKVKSKILNIKGVGPETIKLFCDKLPEFQAFYSQLLAVVNIRSEGLASTKLVGKTFLFSNCRNAEMEKTIKANGGKVSSGISKTVTHLISGGGTSSKIAKAKEYIEQGIDIKIIPVDKSETALLKMLKG